MLFCEILKRKAVPMTEWLDKIHSCGFSADVMFTKDGDRFVALHWKNGHRNVKVFREIDADACLDSALQFAQNYEAYVLTSPECHH